MGLRGIGAKPVTVATPRKRRRKGAGEPWEAAGLSRAGRVIAFIETLTITSGVHAGKPFRLAKQGVAFVNQQSFSQSGPRGGFGAAQVVLFHRDCDAPLLLSDSQAGQTLNNAFYLLRHHAEKKPGPTERLCAFHLPALISKINHALGLTPDEAGTAGPM